MPYGPGGRTAADLYKQYYNTKLPRGQLPVHEPCVKICVMKILQINSVCSGSTGRIAAGIARVLRRQGHENIILYGRGAPARDAASERFTSDAAVYAHVAYARFTDRQGFFSTQATKRLITRMEEHKPDLIQLHNLHGYYLDWNVLFPWLAACGVPVVWTLHDCNAFTGHCAHFDAAGCERWRAGCGHCPLTREYPKSILLDQSARNFTQKRELTKDLKNLTIVTPSQWLSGLAKESFLGGREIVTVHNGVDLSVFRPRASDIRERYCVGGKRLIIGVANYWEPRKGMKTFFELAEKFGNDVRVALIGLSEKQIRSLPEHIVGVRRTQDAGELAAWYTAADVFVNPTLEDTFAITQIESLACGTPVVAYNVGGCPESLDESCGIVVPKGDVAELSNAVLSAFELSGEDCLMHAKMFDQQDCYREYADLYAQLCKEGGV